MSPTEPPKQSRLIRPSQTRSRLALWAKSLINAIAFFAIFMAALPWAAHWLLPAPLPVPAGLGLGAGALLATVGAALWLYCLDVFSRRSGGTPFPLDAPRHLATTGPFHIIRNPIMAGELMVVWGEGLFFASVGITVYAVLLSLLAHLAVVYAEEPDLRARFGSAYDEYAARVPRWFPQRLREPAGGEPES